MNQKLIVVDTEMENHHAIEGVNVSIWSELNDILEQNGIAVRDKSVFQGNQKEPFKALSDKVLQIPVLYIYLFPDEMESGLAAA